MRKELQVSHWAAIDAYKLDGYGSNRCHSTVTALGALLIGYMRAHSPSIDLTLSTGQGLVCGTA